MPNLIEKNSWINVESACNAGDPGLIPRWGRSPGEGKGYPLQYPGVQFHGLYTLWGRKELDKTDRLSLSVGFPGGSDGKK